MGVGEQAEGVVEEGASAGVVFVVFGQALARAVGDKRGISRYGHAYVPLDEALSRVVIDLSGRPGLVFECAFTRASIGRFETQLVEEFFRAVVNHAGMTLHIDTLRGSNAHHQAETIFKAFGRALRMALTPDVRQAEATHATAGATVELHRHRGRDPGIRGGRPDRPDQRPPRDTARPGLSWRLIGTGNATRPS